jgi:hypothetical protein
MRIRRLRIANFRGFENHELLPREHVFLVGQPGAGRSDLIEGLRRVLSPDSTRFPLADDLDFFRRDLAKRIEIEAIVGDLNAVLEQAFLDRLEFWDLESAELIEELSPAEDDNSLERVVRLSYRAEWDSDQQQARHWVDFPKFSDPEANDYRLVPRALREQLPAAFVLPGGAPLSLASRGDLRQLVDAGGQTDFSTSIEQLIQGVTNLAEELVQSEDLAAVLERLLEPLRIPLGLGDQDPTDIIRFAPEGGSLAGILRSLQPTLRLREELGFLPLTRHGSTITGLLQISRALARSGAADAIVVVDDFGEGIDIDAAQHLAALLRTRSGQLWLSTRLGMLGQCFRPDELVRLTVSGDGSRRVHSGNLPVTKSDRLAARHLHLQILPAVSSKTVVIVEGPHDRATLHAVAARFNEEEAIPLPAAHRIAFIDAGSAEGSGGIGAIPRLAKLAKELGFFAVAIIDWDNDEGVAQQCLTQNLAEANVVIRWPRNHGVERVVLSGLSDDVIRATINDVAVAMSINLDFDPGTLAGAQLKTRTVKFLKSSGGFHRPFVEALPEHTFPSLLTKCLEEVRQAFTKSGLVQL